MRLPPHTPSRNPSRRLFWDWRCSSAYAVAGDQPRTAARARLKRSHGEKMSYRKCPSVQMPPAMVRSACAVALAIALCVHAAYGQVGSLADGNLVAWGDHTYGQTDVPPGAFSAVSGSFHSLGLRPDGTLAGWGLNGQGQATVPPGTFKAIAA